MRISNSFSEGEIQVLEFILQTLLRGGTPSMATRNKDFAAVYRKAMTMKKRVEEKKSHAKISSSVGTVAAAEDDHGSAADGLALQRPLVVVVNPVGVARQHLDLDVVRVGQID